MGTTRDAEARAASWHLVSGEYPPQSGGVSDYTQQLAQALAEVGERVHVWAPGGPRLRFEGPVTIHGVPGFGPRGLAALSAGLSRIPGPRRILVQYVATAYGYRGLNGLFALWLASLDDELWVQFHEVAHAFAWSQPPQRNVLAAVEWWMARLVADHARRIFISIPGWRRQLGRNAPRAEVLPIPSNLPFVVSPDDAMRLRHQLTRGPLVGHFGTYGSLVTDLLLPIVVSILRSTPDVRFLLLGRGGVEFAAVVASTHPDLASRLVAPGVLDAASASLHLAACDLLVQPYPDGISGRRTSAMAGLALGRPIVSTIGSLTEHEWGHAQAALLVPVGAPNAMKDVVLRLLESQAEREALGARGRAWYEKRFSINHTLDMLGVTHPSANIRPCPNER